MGPTDHLQDPAPGPRLPGGFAVLGVRTTGPSPSRGRLVEVAVVLLDPAGAAVRDWTTLVDAHGHGSTPTFARVAGELAGMLGGRVLVAHDAAPALACLRAEFARLGVAAPPAPQLCTLEASWRYLPPLPRRRLGDCCAAAGVPDDRDGTALASARGTAALLRWYLTCPGQHRDDALARLVQRAPSATWPAVPGPRAVPVPRTAPATAPFTPVAGPRRLAVLLHAMRLDLPELPLPVGAGYAEAVVRVLADGALTAERAGDLADVAGACGLLPVQARATHRGVLRELARVAGQAGPLDASERAEVLGAAAALDVDAADLDLADLDLADPDLADLDDVLGSPQGPPVTIDLRATDAGAAARTRGGRLSR